MAKLHEVQAELANAIAAYNALIDPRPSERKPIKEKVETLRADLQELLIVGAESCPECSQLPFGIEQPYAYEICCLSESCSSKNYLPKGRRAQGRTIEQAVDNWNAESYIQK
jgi:hypothetical protein